MNMVLAEVGLFLKTTKLFSTEVFFFFFFFLYMHCIPCGVWKQPWCDGFCCCWLSQKSSLPVQKGFPKTGMVQWLFLTISITEEQSSCPEGVSKNRHGTMTFSDYHRTGFQSSRVSKNWHGTMAFSDCHRRTGFQSSMLSESTLCLKKLEHKVLALYSLSKKLQKHRY